MAFEFNFIKKIKKGNSGYLFKLVYLVYSQNHNGIKSIFLKAGRYNGPLIPRSHWKQQINEKK